MEHNGKGVFPRLLAASEDHGATWRRVRTEAVRRRMIEPRATGKTSERDPG
jgi:hypothetical protein